MSQLDYGIVGNCQCSALIDRFGRVVWCCMPRFDSASIFAALLDEGRGGFWSIEAFSENGGAVPLIRQHYIRNTNVLLTRVGSPDGDQFEIIDFMPRFHTDHGLYRPVELMRVVRPLKGAPKIMVRLRPRFEYGCETPSATPLSNGIAYSGGQKSVFLGTDISVTHILQETAFELKESRHFVLSFGEPFRGLLKFSVEERLERTIAYWRDWVKHCNIPFEFQNEVIRSALTLKLHIFEDTGAIIAATTTSIPEGMSEGEGSGRNWDYRYCWLRDAYFVVTALNQLGQFEEMEQFIRYLQNICMSDASSVLQPVYGIGGEKILEEVKITSLSGFRGIGPVRIGNAAYKMVQNDVYGEMVLALAPAFFDLRLEKTDQASALRSVERLVEQAIGCFDQPDAGLWEFRKERRHSVFSKLMCWAAVDRGIRIAIHIKQTELINAWAPMVERMRLDIEKNGWNEFVGYYTQSYGGDSPDAANLLLPAINFVSYRDERFQKTMEAYERMLRVGDGVFRYRTPDDFGVPQTSFMVCSFWMVDALWGVGKQAEARELFTSLIRRASPLGLLSEDMDTVSGELWGNFPQTYSHVGLIRSAMKISKPWEDAF